jgi:hypothetical protein
MICSTNVISKLAYTAIIVIQAQHWLLGELAELLKASVIILKLSSSSVAKLENNPKIN